MRLRLLRLQGQQGTELERSWRSAAAAALMTGLVMFVM